MPIRGVLPQTACATLFRFRDVFPTGLQPRKDNTEKKLALIDKMNPQVPEPCGKLGPGKAVSGTVSSVELPE
jgi:hypothetical protein